MVNSALVAEIPVLLTVREVADALRTGKTTVYSYVRSGALESVRFGGSVRIPADALREFVNRERTTDEVALRPAGPLSCDGPASISIEGAT